MAMVFKVYISDFTWWSLILALPLHALLCGLSIWSIRDPRKVRWAIASATPLLFSLFIGGIFCLHTVSIAVALGVLFGSRAGRVQSMALWVPATIGAAWFVLQGVHHGDPESLIRWLAFATSPVPAGFW